MKIAVITSTFYKDISARLLNGVTKALTEAGLTEWEVIDVPGTFEIPYMAAKVQEKYDGIIVLGCVIKGETDHYEYVCQGVTYGVQKLSVEQKIPIGFGILTCTTKDQALDRSGDNIDNKGYTTAKTVISLLSKND